MSSGAALVSDTKNLQFSNLLDLAKSEAENCWCFWKPEPWGPTHNSKAISHSASSSIEVAQDNEGCPEEDTGLIQSRNLGVLQGLTEVGYQVVSVTTDGHKVNTAFQAELGVTPDKPWFANPFVENQEQHDVINDTVHLWKNGFYQLLNKKKLVAPPFPGSKARIIS
ncbi:hypothetical protein GWK47_007687 [Chionoecetes opilio]|uniref:Uncharacterized protein n=1 Tax=Chionoecetes opilio TaxID=41210 RepID=A0A8J4Y055_CHIOP|nr:hypothetical protein GWK47_007687 [Chionoecetes opilio]